MCSAANRTDLRCDEEDSPVGAVGTAPSAAAGMTVAALEAAAGATAAEMAAGVASRVEVGARCTAEPGMSGAVAGTGAVVGVS